MVQGDKIIVSEHVVKPIRIVSAVFTSSMSARVQSWPNRHLHNIVMCVPFTLTKRLNVRQRYDISLIKTELRGLSCSVDISTYQPRNLRVRTGNKFENFGALR